MKKAHLTNGESFNYFKAGYLYNLNTKIAVEVSNRWIEGTNIDFMMIEKFIVLRKVVNPYYDYIGTRISEEEIDKAKDYSFLVIRLNDFSIVDDICSQNILKNCELN